MYMTIGRIFDLSVGKYPNKEALVEPEKNILGNLENVGYALPTQESIYNIVIMEEVQSIIGLGCGASSKFVHPKTGAITHFANPKDPKSYNDGFVKYTEDKLKILEELFA